MAKLKPSDPVPVPVSRQSLRPELQHCPKNQFGAHITRRDCPGGSGPSIPHPTLLLGGSADRRRHPIPPLCPLRCASSSPSDPSTPSTTGTPSGLRRSSLDCNRNGARCDLVPHIAEVWVPPSLQPRARCFPTAPSPRSTLPLLTVSQTREFLLAPCTPRPANPAIKRLAGLGSPVGIPIHPSTADNEPPIDRFFLAQAKKSFDRKMDFALGVWKGPKRAKMAQNASKTAQSGQKLKSCPKWVRIQAPEIWIN